MKANIRKSLFILTVIILGIGVGMVFIYDTSSLSKETKPVQSVSELMAKYHTLRQNEKIDLSSDEDLTVAVMNLLGIEEHLFFTEAKTRKTEYYDMIDEVREVRKELLKKLIPAYEGEVWCISKHLLAASYRLMETGTKQLHSGNKQEAYKLFEQGYRLYLLIWKINKNISASGTATSSTQMNLAPDVIDKNSLIHLNDMTKDRGLKKSCVFNDSKINCCAE